VAATFADRVFFSNSGAEAVEASIKTARRFHFVRGAPERFRIVTFEGAFHGRTLATIAPAGRPNISRASAESGGFRPGAFGDRKALEAPSVRKRRRS
jgi:acetylornithine/N-succinyldiaminopimelate aminotransferase